MNSKRQHLIRALLLTGAIALTAPAGVMAANNYTPACTSITNTAKATYLVNGVDPTGGTGVTSSAAQFYVGVKVDHSITRVEGAEVPVLPGATAQLLNFTVTNNGNATMKYALVTTEQPGTTPDPFPATTLKDTFDAVAASLKTNGTVGTSGTILSIDPDQTANATISITVPNSPTGQTALGVTNATYVDRALAVYTLKATAQWAGSGLDVGSTDDRVKGATIGGNICNAPVPAVADIDFVVATPVGSDNVVRSGSASVRHAYKVNSAQITIDKSSAVLFDPVNCPGDVCGLNTPRMIPGATMEYTIVVTNVAGSGSSATLSEITDTLVANLKIVTAGASWSVTGGRATTSGALTADVTDGDGDGLGHENPALVGGKVTANLNTILAAGGGYTIGELKSGEAVTVKFRAIIQ